MITLDHVSKIYNLKGKPPVAAVRDADLTVTPGEFVVITGRSGSGKTTLLNLMAGLVKPSTGKVVLDGVDLWSLSDAEQSLLRNRTIGFVFQFPSLLPSLTALENVALPTMFGDRNGRQDAYARAEDLLHEVGLSEKLSSYPRHLSAGQQQRVVVARSLINQPQVLMADEPTSNLDEQTEQEIIALFQEIHRRNGVTILLVTHGGLLVPCGTRTLHMADGAIAADKSTARPCRS